MKRAVITILGTIGVPREGQEKAEYFLSDSLKEDFSVKRDRYTNMLPLLIDNLKDSYGTIECIYTEDAQKIQSKVLDYEHLDFKIEDNGFFISNIDGEAEAKYSFFLEKYNKVIEKYDRVIIDVSHGFRHLPILATVDMIMQNIKDPKKIEYIFFAKEIEKFSKYEVVDLKEYLELANLSFMLSSFNQNYTVSSNIRFKNQLYKKIAKELSDFSHHFLSNSLKPLIEGSLISDIIDNLEKLQKDKAVENFKHYIEDIILHLEDIRQLKYASEWQKLYEISKIMDTRGYQLNAITLLFESVGFYCLESLSNIDMVDKRTKEYYGFIAQKRKPENIYSTYTMTNQIRTLVKIQNRFHVSDERLFIANDKVKNTIIEYLDDVSHIHKFEKFIQDLEALRNNLAHGNSSNSIGNVKQSYQSHLSRFKDLCIDKDIFSTAKLFDKKSTVDRLNNKWQ
ncbi:CRISPR-associated DxTHG motif protein [bacterium]|nr:CRISPR-associated DxTHG motif protein [bacterium]MBU1956924.1 CRISPR-associated DxTHG motif protein [bacterium]